VNAREAETSPTSANSPRGALDRLVAEHAAGVFRFLRTMVGDAETARDLVQDTFLRLHPHAAEAGPGLVFTVARSCALDHRRRSRFRRRHEQPAADDAPEAPDPARTTPDRTYADREFRDHLAAALAMLPEDQRAVFHLSEVEGLPYADIAAVLGISAGTVASRKHHAVRKLREHLRRLGYAA
jgi:RNA polymerase sigma-70 factor (ECF subfamily)